MEITLHTTAGPVPAKAIKVEKGLAIHPALNPDKPLGTFYARKVAITHVASGLTATAPFSSRKAAELALETLLAAGDWERPLDEVKYDEALQRAAADVRDNPPKAPKSTPRQIPVLRTVTRLTGYMGRKQDRSVVWEEGGLTVECAGAPMAGNAFYITHDASGKTLGSSGPRTPLIRRAKRLLPLVDWTLPEVELFRELRARDYLLEQVRQIAEGEA